VAEVTHKSHVKEYVIIFILLGVLTVMELAVPELKIAYAKKAIALTLLALAKAFMVGYYYMHLKDEKGWLKFIALIPLSAALYFIMVALESVYR
jgi:cytochrome c oxidase subunit 4